jgi:S-formylglutathione hydrolase FrmB
VQRLLVLLACALAAGVSGCSAGSAHVPAAHRAGTRASRRSSVPVGLSSVTIPADTSDYDPRPALVYVPPAARTSRRPLPVLELLHGEPGSPGGLARSIQLLATMQAFAAAHGGSAPIVVVPDVNGAQDADSECVRTTQGGDVERYLTVDVPRWVMAHLPASRRKAQWAIAGLSEGGTCSSMLALRNYPEYRAFADLSGLLRPTLGDTDAPGTTTRQLFGGSTTAFDEHDPLWLLQHHSYPELAGWFACGDRDTVVLRDQKSVAAAARPAGVAVHAAGVPGGHTWSVWTLELRKLLPWVWALVT